MRVCPICECESATKVLSYAPSPWNLRECAQEGFIFLENPPEVEEYTDHYAWEATSKTERAARKKAEPVLHMFSDLAKKIKENVLKRNKVKDLIDSIINKSNDKEFNVLDLGCGWGGLLESIYLENKDRCVPFGIEISRKLSEISNDKFSQLGGKVIHDSAVNGIKQFKPSFFNLIIMSSYLEHEIQPLPVLRHCFEHCLEGGYIVIKVPNYACLNRMVRGARWCGFRWPDHVNYFTPVTLSDIAHRAGFKVLRMNMLDRHPLSDSMYAVLQKPDPARGVT